MNDFVITPEVAVEAEVKNKPALVVISKMNVNFNMAATKLLALKKGDQFLIVLKGNVLHYKDVASAGFQISVVNNKGASLINKGLHIVLNDKFMKNDKSFRFEIGEINEGTRVLTLKN